MLVINKYTCPNRLITTTQAHELDVISLCCDYYEGNAQEIVNDYKDELSEAISLADEYGQTIDDIVSEWLQDQGILIAEYDVDGITHFLYRPY